MKITVPQKEVELCDCCSRDGFLQTCKACGGRYCLLCDAYLPGCIHRPDVCRKCCDNEQVKAIADKYAPKLLEILKARDAEFAKVSNA